MVKAAEKFEDDFFCSVNWNSSGGHIALGSDQGVVDVVEGSTCSPLWTSKCHQERISAISWMNEYVFSTGSRDNTVRTFDLRKNQKSPLAVMAKHTQDVCGLKWSISGGFLASGGNDNTIHIWDSRK